MDIGLKLLYVKGLIKKNIWKIKLTREDLEKKRPSAVEYINGAKDTEKDLQLIEQSINDLETELRLQGREINRCLQINGQLKQRINELEHELKYRNIEL